MGTPEFVKYMTLSRYFQIKGNLHLSKTIFDNGQVVVERGIAKVKEFGCVHPWPVPQSR